MGQFNLGGKLGFKWFRRRGVCRRADALETIDREGFDVRQADEEELVQRVQDREAGTDRYFGDIIGEKGAHRGQRDRRGGRNNVG